MALRPPACGRSSRPSRRCIATRAGTTACCCRSRRSAGPCSRPARTDGTPPVSSWLWIARSCCSARCQRPSGGDRTGGSKRGCRGVLRPLVLIGVILAAGPAFGQDALPASFHGDWQGKELTVDEGSGDLEVTAEDLSVRIAPDDSGFRMHWTALAREGVRRPAGPASGRGAFRAGRSARRVRLRSRSRARCCCACSATPRPTIRWKASRCCGPAWMAKPCPSMAWRSTPTAASICTSTCGPLTGDGMTARQIASHGARGGDPRGPARAGRRLSRCRAWHARPAAGRARARPAGARRRAPARRSRPTSPTSSAPMSATRRS